MIELTLPWPPSMNTYWRHVTKGALAGRTLISQDGRDYRAAVAGAVLQQGRPRIGDARCAIDIEVRMPDRRRRDLDNLPKAILDSLTHAGLWCDDSQVDDLRVWRSDRAGGVIVVRLRVLESAQSELLEASA